MIPTLADIQAAHQRIAPHIHRTPVLTSQAINQICGAELFFKCENFQKTGAFKIRGATNAILLLEAAEAQNGVATHSSGNHGAALACAARSQKMQSWVVMPENASEMKKKAVAAYGAEIVWCGSQLESREATLTQVLEETGAHFIHPFNETRVIAGQGTAALELLEEVALLDGIVAPVGGGGLLSGTALVAKALAPQTQVIGAEPQGADDAHRSLQQGKLMSLSQPNTLADGLRTSLGDLTFPIIQKHVSEVILVSEETIVAAMRLIWERMKIIVEPSSAVALGAVLTQKEALAGMKIGVILSGGNIDLDHLPWHSPNP